MAFMAGAIHDDYNIQTLFSDNGNIIHGVDFTTYARVVSNSTTATSASYIGTSTTTNKNFKATFSNHSSYQIDPYTGSSGLPFSGIRECCTRYNSTTGEQEVVSYEGDPTWDTDKIKPEYNRMIEFPFFYFRRPNWCSFYVSPNQNIGVPSPMHYRNGKLYDYVYISKYFIDHNGKSKIGSTPISVSVYDRNNIRDVVRKKGMYLMDYPAYCMITILGLIKYKYLELYNSTWTDGSIDALSSYFSAASYDMTGYSVNTLSKDYFGSGYQVFTSLFGLENFHNSSPGTVLDGAYIYKNINSDTVYNLYIPQDIENFTTSPTTEDEVIGTKCNTEFLSSPCPIASSTGLIAQLVTDSVFPFSLLASTVNTTISSTSKACSTMRWDFATGALNVAPIAQAQYSSVYNITTSGSHYARSMFFRYKT